MIKSFIKRILANFGIGVTVIPKRPLFRQQALKTIKVGKYDLRLNRNHTLGFNIKHYPLYNQNLPRLVAFLSQTFPALSVIDIGANVGDTVLFIKNKADVPVICVEGNEFYFGLLKENTKSFDNVTVIKAFLSDKAGVFNAQFRFDKGTLSVYESNEGNELNVTSLDDIIGQHPALFSEVRVLKTDTDGYDMKIIRGAWNFLRTKSPVLFVEYDRVYLKAQGENGIDTLRQLADIGYYRIFFYDNYGRFITMLTMDCMASIESLHEYIEGYRAAFEFYDLCIFHRRDDELAMAFYRGEHEINAGRKTIS
jgi:FkbM family methyltransferase